MTSVYNSADMRAIDAEAIASGIASTDLMDSAACALDRTLERAVGPLRGKTITIFAGAGNNGGDGFSLGSILIRKGVSVRMIYVGENASMTADCSFMRSRFESMGGETAQYYEDCFAGADAAVDAMFGISFRGKLTGQACLAAKAMNSFSGFVLAADLPSGLYSDYGGLCENAVCADATVCFSYPKPSCLLMPSAANCGQIIIEGIGIDPSIAAKHKSVFGMIDEHCLDVLPKKARSSYKNLHGHGLIVAGSARYCGAPYLAVSAAVRCGVGLLSCALPASIYAPVSAKLTSAMPYRMPNTDYLGADSLYELLNLCAQSSAVLIGPGLGREDDTCVLVRDMLSMINIPVILDADGINALSGHIDILSRMPQTPVLTPHDGEFARLFGEKPPADGRARLLAVQTAASKNGCIIVLKGHRTIVAAPDGRVYVNSTGNPGMAKGGSGDVLSGILLAFISQSVPAFEAACAAVWLHGSAGDAAAARLSEYGMTPDDIIDELPALLKCRDSIRYF